MYLGCIFGYQLKETNMITQDQIRKITGKAALEFNENNAFVSFRNLSVAAANASVKKLKDNGFDALRIEQYVKINIPV